jgi:hypothetical protein
MDFPTFVDRVNAAVRSVLERPAEVSLEETASTATWIRDSFRAGVKRTPVGLEAWVGIRGRVGRRWSEAYDESSVERLAIAFSTILCGEDAADDAPPDAG